MRNMLLVLTVAMCAVILGCPPPPHRQGPAHKPEPEMRKTPPGQTRRQENPSGHKPIPPGQMKKSGHEEDVVIVAPPLPSIVVFEVEPYYFYQGFYYYIDGDVWYYSETKGGPKVKLPKSHYPKEVRHKGKGKGKGRDK